MKTKETSNAGFEGNVPENAPEKFKNFYNDLKELSVKHNVEKNFTIAMCIICKEPPPIQLFGMAITVGLQTNTVVPITEMIGDIKKEILKQSFDVVIKSILKDEGRDN